MVALMFFSLGVNQSGPKTRSTTNHKFYKTLEQLHGPWCKQPLTYKIVEGSSCWRKWSKIKEKVMYVILMQTYDTQVGP
jgi:hypothetical protein